MDKHRHREADIAAYDAGAYMNRPLLPSLRFESAQGADVALRTLASGWLVIYCYPGAPEHDALESHLEDIREHEAFARRVHGLRHRAVSVAALSSQPVDEQVDTMLALGLEHHLLCDPALTLAHSLDLPTTTIAGRRYYCRQTLIIRERRVEHVFSPAKDAGRSPIQVETWMLAHGW
jgi:peroxiredoxin